MYAFEITEVMGSRISDFGFYYESNGNYGNWVKIVTLAKK